MLFGQVRARDASRFYGHAHPTPPPDLLEDAVLVGGLDFWRFGNGFDTIEEPRLREDLARRLIAANRRLALSGAFRLPPTSESSGATLTHGIAVQELPRWFVCQNEKCRALVRSADGLTLTAGRYLHDCDGAKKPSPCVPVRFVAGCVNGHLDDFPWKHFAHEGKPCAAPSMRLRRLATHPRRLRPGHQSRVLRSAALARAGRQAAGGLLAAHSPPRPLREQRLLRPGRERAHAPGFDRPGPGRRALRLGRPRRRLRADPLRLPADPQGGRGASTLPRASPGPATTCCTRSRTASSPRCRSSAGTRRAPSASGSTARPRAIRSPWPRARRAGAQPRRPPPARMGDGAPVLERSGLLRTRSRGARGAPSRRRGLPRVPLRRRVLLRAEQHAAGSNPARPDHREFRRGLLQGPAEEPLSAPWLESLGWDLAAASLLAGLEPSAARIAVQIALAERAVTGPRLELVWTGPEAKMSVARDTAVVVRELLAAAERDVLIAGFRFDHGDELSEALEKYPDQGFRTPR